MRLAATNRLSELAIMRSRPFLFQSMLLHVCEMPGLNERHLLVVFLEFNSPLECNHAR